MERKNYSLISIDEEERRVVKVATTSDLDQMKISLKSGTLTSPGEKVD